MNQLSNLISHRSKTFLLAAISSMFSIIAPAEARDTIHEFSIADALNSYRAEGLIDQYIPLYFHDQPTPSILKNYGRFKTNKKTNAFNKTDLEACQWVFLSAVRQLQHKADSIGGNAVINVQSNYRGVTFKSNSEFRCGAGAIIAGVALKGEIVKIQELPDQPSTTPIEQDQAQNQEQASDEQPGVEILDAGPSD